MNRAENAILRAADEIRAYRSARMAARKMFNYGLIDEATREHITQTCDIRTDSAVESVKESVSKSSR